MKKIKLRQHQLTSIAAMSELEKQGSVIIDKPNVTSGLYNIVRYNLVDVDEFMTSTYVIETNSAILADKVGSGKTFIIIGLLLHSPCPQRHDRFIAGTEHFSIKMISSKESEPLNLIVVPHNLVNQWSSFMEKTDLKYLKLNTVNDFNIFFDCEYVSCQIPMDKNSVYLRTKKKTLPGSKEALPPGHYVYEKKTFNAEKYKKIIEENCAILLNINRYKEFERLFKGVKWARVIIDEMDSVNVPYSFNEYGNFNWFLTATPSAIFYKSCRRYVNKIFGGNQSLLEYFTVKNNDAYVNQSMILPKPFVYFADSMLHRVVSAIQDLIPQNIMNLINSGNMKEAINQLNCDVDTEENIVKVLTEKIIVEKHNLKKELKYVKGLIANDKDAHKKRIEKIQSDIARCKTRLDAIHERISSIADDCCFICADDFDNPTILDCCKSVFCFTCLLSALKAGNNKCPYCRQVIKSNKEYHIIGKKSNKKQQKIKKKKNSFTEMDKSKVLEKILSYIAKYDDNPKILIFSDYYQTFDKIVDNIYRAGLKHKKIAGTPAHITNIISDFDEAKVNVLLLDSQHYGSGLNLQTANYLILYHRMKPELETQVIGRAQRFGRKTSLKIIYMVNESENRNTDLTDKPLKIQSPKDLPLIFDVDDVDDVDDDTEDIPDEESEEEIIPKKKSKKKKYIDN